jgi:PAS domain S-box-containing protein
MTLNPGDIAHFLDLVRMIIIVIDSDQKVTYVNRKGCEILGLGKEDILGKNWFDNFLPEKIRNDIKTVYTKLMAGEIELAEYFDNVVLTKDGQERIIGWHNAVLKSDAGAIVGTLSCGEDITERRMTDKKSEDLIQELQDRLTELKSMKMKIPICSWNKKDLREAMERHYRHIAAEGKCSECLRIFKIVSQIKE